MRHGENRDAAGGLLLERLVWSFVRVLDVEGVQRLLQQRRQVQVPVVALPEVASHGAVEPLDVSIAFRRAGWQYVEGNPRC